MSELVDVTNYGTELYGKPVHVFAEVLEAGAIKQFEDVMKLDCIVKGAMMADTHQGFVMPIGGVVASDGVIFPSFVGFDQGCGVLALPTTFRKLHVKEAGIKLFNNIMRDVPCGLGKINESCTEWDYGKYNMTDTAKAIFEKDGLKQLGSLGSNNHFLSLEADEDDTIWIVIHSGSRKLGHSLATHYMKVASNSNKAKEGLFGLKVSEPAGQEYITDLNFCLEFALENRMEMARRVASVVHKYCIGRADWDNVINRNHNHAELKDGLWIHRKGATQAEAGMLGVIPGNMRDGSFIVRGLGNPESLWSSSHGAGRVMSRKEAKNSLTVSDFKKQMEGVVCRVDAETLDESPGAYKDIFQVMRLQSALVETLHHTKTMVNIKA